MIDLNIDNFDSIIADGKVLVDFWASWCGPCINQLGILEEIKNPAYKICKVNVDENKELAKRFKVMGIPALMAFEGGQLINSKTGVLNEDDINKLFIK
ncbi:MAG: thioredoxin family protein [Firmicutes bacterium]|nr:thioredoxin family protein [Bacillota bacterium]